MRIIKIFLAVFLLCAINFCYAEKAKDGHQITWNKDGTVNKTVSIYEGVVHEAYYAKAIVVNVKGELINKQERIQDAYDKKIGQISYVYSKPFDLIRGENFSNGKLSAITYYKNNKYIKMGVDSSMKGKLDEWIYYDENQKVIKIERNGKILKSAP